MCLDEENLGEQESRYLAAVKREGQDGLQAILLELASGEILGVFYPDFSIAATELAKLDGANIHLG